jgi:hypothetical protein
MQRWSRLNALVAGPPFALLSDPSRNGVGGAVRVRRPLIRSEARQRNLQDQPTQTLSQFRKFGYMSLSSVLPLA